MKYAVGYNGQTVTRPMSLEEAASLAASLNADNSLEFNCIEFEFEVIAIQEMEKSVRTSRNGQFLGISSFETRRSTCI